MLNTTNAFDEPQLRRPISPMRFDQAQIWKPQHGAAGKTVKLFPQGSWYDQIRSKRDNAQQLRLLQQHYTILGSSDLISEILAEHPSIDALLIEAITPLRAAFGDDTLLQIRAQVSDDDILLKATVQLPCNFSDPESALLAFDSAWWLNNCHRSGGTLVFDYELLDAV